MSRIGKLPIMVPAGVTVTQNGSALLVKGSLGDLSLEIVSGVTVEIGENEIIVKRDSDEKKDRSLHGLFRTLIDNMIIGVSKGFEKRLEIHGVGYRASVSGPKITLSLGYSHPVELVAPQGVSVEMSKEEKNVIIVKGIDKQKVGEFSAVIRKQKKPEPYKGKGIRYVGEYVPRKAGKAASKEK